MVVVALSVVLISLGSGTATAADQRISMYQGVAGVDEARQINISSLHAKPLALYFRIALCPPILAEMPGFQQFYNEFKSVVTLLGVDIESFTGFLRQLPSRGRDSLEKLGVTYPDGFTTDSSTPRRFKTMGMPQP